MPTKTKPAQTTEARPRLYRLDEAAELLSSSEQTLNRLIDAGRIHTVRVGAQRRITQAEMDRLLTEGTGER